MATFAACAMLERRANLRFLAACPPRRGALNHLAPLDGLRACAAFLVLLTHFPYITDSKVSHALWAAGKAGGAGFIGVDVFFALSGFLITRILLEERQRSGMINFKAFFTRRAFRIFPIYYLCVFGYILINRQFGAYEASAIGYVMNFYEAFHTSEARALNPLWSLGVEEQFYLIWPVLLTVFGGRTWGFRLCLVIVPLVALASAAVLAWTLPPEYVTHAIFMFTPTRSVALALGASLAFRERDGAPLSSAMALGALAAGIVALLTIGIAWRTGFLQSHALYWGLLIFVMPLTSYGVLATLLFARSRIVDAVRAALSARPMRTLGRISYGTYLYHMPVLFLFGIPEAKTVNTGAPALTVFLALGMTIGLAALSYALIERPLLRLRDRLFP